jgi:hypothetical protein
VVRPAADKVVGAKRKLFVLWAHFWQNVTLARNRFPKGEKGWRGKLADRGNWLAGETGW